MVARATAPRGAVPVGQGCKHVLLSGGESRFCQLPEVLRLAWTCGRVAKPERSGVVGPAAFLLSPTPLRTSLHVVLSKRPSYLYPVHLEAEQDLHAGRIFWIDDGAGAEASRRGASCGQHLPPLTLCKPTAHPSKCVRAFDPCRLLKPSKRPTRLHEKHLLTPGTLRSFVSVSLAGTYAMLRKAEADKAALAEAK